MAVEPTVVRSEVMRILVASHVGRAIEIHSCKGPISENIALRGLDVFEVRGVIDDYDALCRAYVKEGYMSLRVRLLSTSVSGIRMRVLHIHSSGEIWNEEERLFGLPRRS